MTDKFTGTIQYNGKPINLYDGRPIDTAEDIAGNAWQDAGEIFKGLGTIGSAGIARGLEAVPLHDPQAPLGKPLLRTNLIGTAPDLGDIGLAGSMAMGMVNNYKQAYVDPFLTGQPANVLKQVAAHPLNTAFDLLPAAKPLGLGKAAGAISKTEAVQSAMAKTQAFAKSALQNGVQKAGEVVTKAQESTNPVVRSAGQAAESAADAIGEAASKATQKVKQVNQASKMQQQFADAMIDEDNKFLAEVGTSWRKIPKNIRGQVQAYAEGWHPNLLSGKGIPEAIQKYLAVAEQYSGVMRQRITGLVDESALAMDKYQPATIKLTGLDTKSWQALDGEEQARLLAQTKATLEGKGIFPQYSPHVRKFEMEGVTADPTRIKDKLTDKRALQELALQKEIEALKNQGLEMRSRIEQAPDIASKQLLQEQLDEIHKAIKKKMEKKAGYLKTKQTAGENSITSHFDSLRTRWLQIGQLHHAYEKVLQATIEKGVDLDWLKNAPDPGSKQIAAMTEAELQAKGLIAVDAQEMARSILGELPQAVASIEEIEKLILTSFPKVIYLDKTFASALKVFSQAITPKANFPNRILKHYDESIALSKRYMLGGNLTYAEAQGVQQAGMLEYVSINGPRDFVISLLAWRLACKESVRNAIPANIAEDIIMKEITGKQYLKEAIDFARNANPTASALLNPKRNPFTGMVAAYDNFVSFNLARAQLYDSFIRAKAGTFYFMKIAEKDAPIGQVVRDMLSTEKSIAAIESLMFDQVALNNVNKEVLKACGNFRALSGKPIMRLLGRLTPFPSWLVYISQYTSRLPGGNPYKWMITQQVGRLAEEYMADPLAPSTLKGGVAIEMKGPNGGNLLIKKDAFNPLTSVGDLAAYAQQLFAGQGDKRVPSLLVAPLQLAFIIGSRLNTMTLQDFKDPRLVQGQYGEQFRPVDVVTGRARSGEAQPVRPMPDYLTLAMRQFFGPLERQLETFAEKIHSGGQRSQMSTPFVSAPKRDATTKQVKKSFDWLQLVIQQTVNVTPIEYTAGDRARDMKSKIANNRALLRAVMRMGE